MALENLYFNTLDREKVQGKSLGCIKGWGDTYATRSHRRGMKESHVAREPRVADPCPRATKESVVSRGLMDRALDSSSELNLYCICCNMSYLVKSGSATYDNGIVFKPCTLKPVFKSLCL